MCTHSERQMCRWMGKDSRVGEWGHGVGQAVHVAVERFVAVGESIACDAPDLRDDMFQACAHARQAGVTIEKVWEAVWNEDWPKEKPAMLRAARALLNSVTRVLLLADVVIVKQLLLTKDKVGRNLGRLTGVTNFTEFVKAFSQFGLEMVELSMVAGGRQHCVKEERRRAQIQAASHVLDRSTMLLLTSSKACLRHPDSNGCRENRDTVFCQMRRAMDLIHFVVKEGVCEGESVDELDTARTVGAAIHQFETLVEMTRLSFITPATRESLDEAAESIFEQTQDFTDSAYTSHEHRENILLLCAQVKLQLNHLLQKEIVPKTSELTQSPSDDIDLAVKNCLAATSDLKNQLIIAAQEQTSDLHETIKLGSHLVTALGNTALSCDEVRTKHYSICFTQHIEQIIEVCKALRHVADSEKLQVSGRYTEINVRIYGPQVIAACMTLIQHPTSKIAKENVQAFIEMWHMITSDVLAFYEEVMDSTKVVKKYVCPPKKQTGVTKHVNTEGEVKVIGTDGGREQEEENWQEPSGGGGGGGGSGGGGMEDSDIVKRAKTMSAMTYSMYQFTKGTGPLNTTQDLFTQAEYFAEESNRLYKVIRQFSYQVPVGSHKKSLLEELDKIPTFVQQLQFTVKNPTVGKAATFSKVDSVIQETNNLMNTISKVVSTCYVCANTYSLDLQGVRWNGSGAGSGGEGGGGRAGADQNKSGSSSSSDPSI